MNELTLFGNLATPLRSRIFRGSLRVLLVLIVLGLGTCLASADTVAVGVLSFDIDNPGATNAFTLYNFTGSNSLAPDFPVADDVTFLGASLTLTDSSGSTANPLGDVGPGSTQLLVLASDDFLEADFSATLSETTFGLSDGTTFQADSDALSVTLLPSSPPDLQAGVDFALITVSGSVVVAPTPEPPTWLLLLAAMLGMAVTIRVRNYCQS